MSGRHLEALQLAPLRTEAAATFLSGYGDACLREQEQISQDTASDGKAYGDQQWWMLQVEAASTYCEAGQWAMFTQPEAALALYRKAGELFRQVDFGFGYYLIATSSSFDELQTRTGRDSYSGLTRAIWDVGQASFVLNDRKLGAGKVAEPLLHPQQQAYLMLAGAVMLPFLPEIEDPLIALAERSSHRKGIIPVGALGVPIGTIWRVALALSRREPSDLVLVAQAILDIGRRYDENINLARINRRLWDNAASPIDAGSMDLVGLTLNTCRAFGGTIDRAALRDTLLSSAGELPPLARNQVDLGFELSEHIDGKG